MSSYAAGTAAATAPTVHPTADRPPQTPDHPRATDRSASPSWFLLLAAAATAHTRPEPSHPDALAHDEPST